MKAMPSANDMSMKEAGQIGHIRSIRGMSRFFMSLLSKIIWYPYYCPS